MAQKVVWCLNSDLLVMEDDNQKLGVYSARTNQMVIGFELDGVRWLNGCDLILVKSGNRRGLISLTDFSWIYLGGAMSIDRVGEAGDSVHWKMDRGRPALLHPFLKEK